jgi:acetyl-CoA carboxylase carboxyl transferase subunit alpha
MSLLKTPILSVVIGEGGSGGALGIGVADRVMILDNAYYSVISPEGCAAILWKDGKRAAEAAEALKITAGDLNDLGVVDRVIEEPEGGAHVDPLAMALRLKEVLVEECRKLMALSTEDLLERRYQKFRAFGEFEQTTLDPSNQAEAQAASAGS